MIHVDVVSQMQPLTRLEWKVVALAIREAGDARCGQSLMDRLRTRVRRWLTGEQPPRPLGDPRLDALRRFVCASRHGVAPRPALADELMSFGFSPAQLAALAKLSH